MMQFLGPATLAYLSGSGFVANGAILTRGVLRATRRLLQSEFDKAGLELASAVIAPPMLAYNPTKHLVVDVVEGATELIDGLLHRGEEGEFEEQAVPMPRRRRQPVA
jgi:hypothetical protein